MDKKNLKRYLEYKSKQVKSGKTLQNVIKANKK